MIRKYETKRLPLAAAAILCGALLLLRPDAVSRGIAAGLMRCAQSMIPALFPFLILSDFIAQTGTAELLCRPFAPLCRALRCPAEGGSALLMGMLGGFASGTSSLAALRSTGRLTASQAEILLCCACVSPSFAVSAVGYGMLGNAAVGWALLIGNWVAGLCAALLVSLWHRRSAEPAAMSAAVSHGCSFGAAFVGSVNNAVGKMLTICGFVVCFALLEELILPSAAPPELALGVSILLELSAGCRAAANAAYGRLFFCTAAMSLLGLCGLAQMRAMLPREVSLRGFLLTRPLHLVVSFGVSGLLLRFVPGGARVLAQGASRVILTSSLPWEGALALFAFLAVSCSAISTLRQRENSL